MQFVQLCVDFTKPIQFLKVKIHYKSMSFSNVLVLLRKFKILKSHPLTPLPFIFINLSYPSFEFFWLFSPLLFTSTSTTYKERGSVCCLPEIQKSIQYHFPQPFPVQKGKIQIGWMVFKIGRNWVNRLPYKGGYQWFSLRLEAYHNRMP